MDMTAPFARAAARPPLATLSRITIGALLGLAGSLVYAQAAIVRQVDPPLVVFSIVMLVVAGIIAWGWRWAPLLGALMSAFVVLGNLSAVAYDLTHPDSFHSFVFMIVAVALAITGVASGTGATLQNYRATDRRAPRGTFAAFALIVGVCVGAMLAGSLSRMAAGASVSPELLASLPAISTPGMRFDQTQLKAKAGETVALSFANTSAAAHTFIIDELSVHVAAAAGNNSLVVFKPAKPGTYTFYCDVPGHREAGMVGTLVVEP